MVVMKGHSGVVTVGNLDPWCLVLESLSEQLTWNIKSALSIMIIQIMIVKHYQA